MFYQVSFARGIGSSGDRVFVGSSSGVVLVIDYVGNNTFKYVDSIGHHKSSIQAVHASGSHVVVGDEEGKISSFNTASLALEASFTVSSNQVITALISKGDAVIAGLSTGTVKIFKISSSNLAVEIDAHSRAIYGMDIHPEQNIFVTCGLDTNVNVFTLPVFDGKSGE
jgi:WD40 repeat protein